MAFAVGLPGSASCSSRRSVSSGALPCEAGLPSGAWHAACTGCQAGSSSCSWQVAAAGQATDQSRRGAPCLRGAAALTVTLRRAAATSRIAESLQGHRENRRGG